MSDGPRRRSVYEALLLTIGLVSLAIAITVALYGDNLVGRGGGEQSVSPDPPAGNVAAAARANPAPSQLRLEEFIAGLGGRWRRTPADGSPDPSTSCEVSASYTFSFVGGVLTLNGPRRQQMRLEEYSDETMVMTVLNQPVTTDVEISRHRVNQGQLLLSYHQGSPYYSGTARTVDIFDRCP
jgi:hypothetical protein